MFKKKIIATLLCVFMSVSVFQFAACDGVSVTPDGNGGVTIKPINPNGGVTVKPDENGGITIKPDNSEDSSIDSSNSTSGEIEICEHEYIWTTTSDATCAKNGTEQGVCQSCGDKTTRSTPKTNQHNYVNDVCTICSKTAVKADFNDLSTSEYISTSIIDRWLTYSRLEVQSEVVSGNSNSALKGAFHENDAMETYDSKQDPNGDGGRWTWTAITLDLTKMYGESKNVKNATLLFDLKVENADSTSSIILYNEEGNRSTQIPFNQSIENPFVSSWNGFTKTILEDGWVRITIDLDKAYPDYNLTNVNYIYLIVSNAFGDHVNDTVFYLDNLYIL